MLELIPDTGKRSPLRILCIGAHCDDIEIGCGATLHMLQRQGRKLVIDWINLTGAAVRKKEAQRAMRAFVGPDFRGSLQVGEFPDGGFPGCYAEIKSHFESLKKKFAPDLILCHERDDRHQDHRIVNEMTWNTFRDHLILEYEIPKCDGGLGQPNVYVPVSAGDARAKVSKLLKAYPSQAVKDWYTSDTFMAMLRLRGLECRSPSGLAEAFHGRKLRFSGG